MATQTDVNPEFVAQEGQETSTAELQGSQPQTAELPDADRNWRRARETMERQERQLKLAEERERTYQEELQRLKQAHTRPQEIEEHFNDTDILTVAQAKKLAAQEAARIVREQEDSMGEDMARREFPDYDAVVTPENLERLKREKPKLFASVAGNSSLYGKATTAYAYLKNLVGSPETQQAAAKLKENAAKPRSALSVAPDKPLHSAHNFEAGMTTELQKSLLQEMQNARRGY